METDSSTDKVLETLAETDSSFRFRQVNDYAWAHEYLSGFPNFHEANHDGDVVRGNFLFRNSSIIGIEWRDIPASQLGNPPQNDIGARFRATNDWCARNGYFAGFPNFHQANNGSGLVYGTILFRNNNNLEWRDIYARDLGNPPQNDIGARFRATNDWCARNGYFAGFPNFHQANNGSGLVYGTFLFKSNSAIEWRDIRADVLGIYDGGFTFDNNITDQQRARVLRRHSFARDRIRACGSLNNDQKNKLFTAYRKRIRHSVSTDPNVNASATLNGSQIWVNFNNLFPQGDNEIAQTLIHEMMHCAGYSHPERQNCSTPPAPPVPCDKPGDNGPYYSTPPLQAELCIAGTQSRMSCKYNKDTNSFRISKEE